MYNYKILHLNFKGITLYPENFTLSFITLFRTENLFVCLLDGYFFSSLHH